jgi:hypothetical protein
MDSMVRATGAKGKSQFRMASIGASDGRHDKTEPQQPPAAKASGRGLQLAQPAPPRRPREAGVSESALQAARLVLEAVNPLRYLARIQRLLDVAVTIVRLRTLERFGQPLDKALEGSVCFAHLMLRRRRRFRRLSRCANVAHNVQIGIRRAAL